MRRVILHSDLNCFYASVEMNLNPELKGAKVAVCGSTDDRHGIVLAASYPAKKFGVKTGMANWQALQLCPGLTVVHPHYDIYLEYSETVRNIYSRYSNDIEPFGMDECWLSIEGLSDVDGEGFETADEIRREVFRETGLTVSVGVSFNKIFAKLGSDMKKPDGVTVISPDNFREKVWPLPVSELLYAGRATTKKLEKMNIRTIGDLARAERDVITGKLGKNGGMLWAFANGYDTSAVMPSGYAAPIKSVGHGTTCKRDVDSEYEIWLVLYELAQDVGHRLRKHSLTAGGVSLFVRDRDLGWEQYQRPLSHPTQSPLEIAQAGYSLFKERYGWEKPVRALTIRGIGIAGADDPEQADLFSDIESRVKRRHADDAIDDIRARFGYTSIKPASLVNEGLTATDRCEDVKMPALMFMD